jgi:hypothetical protein
VGPPRPPRRRVVDVGDGEFLDADTDFGPFADEDLEGFDSTNEVFDFDAEAADSSSSSTGVNRARTVAFRQRERDADADLDARTDVVDEPTARPQSSRPELAFVAGVGTPALDPVVGALKRVRVSQAPYTAAREPGQIGAAEVSPEVAAEDIDPVVDVGAAEETAVGLDEALLQTPRVDTRSDSGARLDTSLEIPTRVETPVDTPIPGVLAPPPRRPPRLDLDPPDGGRADVTEDDDGDDRTVEVDFGGLLF